MIHNPDTAPERKRCGKEKDAPQPTIREFYEFVSEREYIRRRRQLRPCNPPWTQDPILQQYKFCNVKRKHDRTTVEIRKVLEHYKSVWDQCTTQEQRRDMAKDYLMNIALWRRFGAAEFVQQIQWRRCPQTEDDLNVWLRETVDVAVTLWTKGVHSCTDAYNPARWCVLSAEKSWQLDDSTGVAHM